MSDFEVILAVLVEEDISSPQGSLLQVVDKCFLLESEILKAIHFVSQHLEISESLIAILKIVAVLHLVAARA